MNLHAAVSGAISAVNPSQTVIVQSSTGNTADGFGNQTPAYATPVPIRAQVQSLTTSDLMKLNQLNVQGATRSLYCSMQLFAVDRRSQRGGDLVTIGGSLTGAIITGGVTWLVTAILEGWTEAGWNKVAITEQLDGS